MASHNRGGEITYIHLGGLTYQFTITTCTDLGSLTNTDREELAIDFDLGTPFAQKDTFQRTLLTPMLLNHQKNTYVGTHTFTSAGTHRITIEDPNRNAGILNVYPGGNSDDVVFSVETMLIISPTQGSMGGNNSVQFSECPCPEIACVNKPYCYNPMAVDPDGDSLSYELVPPLGVGATPLIIPTLYIYPDQVGGGNFTVDSISGTVCWNNPMVQGEYNFALKIYEWRNGVLVGFVVRDVQLTVQSNCLNDPPEIDPISDTCLIAGENISVSISGNDQNMDNLSLSASGLPLSLNPNSATFNSVSSPGIANGVFQWQTTCSHVKSGSYSVMVSLTDNGNPVFSDYESFNINVIPPALSGISIQPQGNGIFVSWSKPSCNNAEGYNVYRKVGSHNNINDNCCEPIDLVNEGFVPVQQIIGINDTSYFDYGALSLGVEYCYVVTALYNYGQLESCPTDTACAILKKEVPVLTHVNVTQTDPIIGSDSIAWSKPIELDTTQYLGPYHYKINDANGSLIGQTSSSMFLSNTDTIFIHSNINTTTSSRHYSVELYYSFNSQDSLVGESSSASSIHVNTVPNDNEIELSWTEIVPWINDIYFIYKSSSLNGNYVLIDSTEIPLYVDSNLINNIEYCYYVMSSGHYDDSTILSPLFNKSQRVCDVPFDFTPPPPPDLTTNIDSTYLINVNGNLVFQSIENCDLGYNTFNWTNPNNNGADDVVSYNLYFQPFLDSSFSLIKTFSNVFDTTFQHQYSFNGLNSVSGCYYVTAVDSIQYNNESIPSDTVCFDNCPEYDFPNIFTPNQDFNNDYFQALFPIKYIESVRLEIFNRWGTKVFESLDPFFQWDGKNYLTDELTPSGVYYFHCTINTIRLSGLEPVLLNGFVHLINHKVENN